MPIVGLTDRITPAFPELGKLRKGAERTEEDKKKGRPGKDLEWLRFTSDRPEVVKAFEKSYPKDPVLISLYLPFPTVDENWSAWKEEWGASALKHRCDGQTMVRWLGTDGKYHGEAKKCTGGCKEVGRLRVILPSLVQAGYVGFVTVETHSINDIASLQASLMAAADARQGNPRGLQGIEFVLRRVPQKISTPAGEGKRARRQKWLLKIEPAAEWVQYMLQTAHNEAMGLLEAPRPRVDADSGEILEERTPPEDGPEAEADDDADFVPLAETFPDPEGVPEADAEPPTAPSEAWLKAEGKLIDLSNAQGRTLARTQEAICSRENCVWGDLTIAQLEHWTKHLQETGIKVAAKA